MTTGNLVGTSSNQRGILDVHVPSTSTFRATICMSACAACGRFGFDANEPAGRDAATDTAAADGVGGSDAPMALCATSLVAHWKLDETAGAMIADATGTFDGTWNDSGNGNVSNEVRAGQRGGALYFGNGSYFAVPTFVMPSEGTFSAWVTSDFDDSALIAAHPILLDAPAPRTTISYAGDIREYGLRTNDVSWQVSHGPGVDLTGWFHIAATWSVTGAQLYLDGVSVGTPAVGDTRSTSPAGLVIGTRTQLDRMWGGNIDDVRIFNRALSPSEIAQLVGCN